MLRKAAMFSIYVNCKCHRLALVSAHLIMETEHTVSQVDFVLLQNWKIFEFSTVKSSILEEARVTEGA